MGSRFGLERANDRQHIYCGDDLCTIVVLLIAKHVPQMKTKKEK